MSTAPVIRHARLPGGNGILEVETLLPLPVDEVFPFFATAENLQRITPPELDIDVRTPHPVRMKEGTLLEYRLRLFGVRFDWQTRIALWEPPHRFVDEQLRGPYREWIHLHAFESVDEGTRMVDRVRYRLPLHPLSSPVAPAIRHRLERIFRFRGEAVRSALGLSDAGSDHP
jgi:ligand-binding SRPBCC domain-containing protein